MLYDWSMDSNYSTSLGSNIVVCARVGGANTTPLLAAHFAKQNTKFGGEGGIRTHGTVAGTTVFKTVSFNHSDTSPGVC